MPEGLSGCFVKWTKKSPKTLAQMQRDAKKARNWEVYWVVEIYREISSNSLWRGQNLESKVEGAEPIIPGIWAPSQMLPRSAKPHHHRGAVQVLTNFPSFLSPGSLPPLEPNSPHNVQVTIHALVAVPFPPPEETPFLSTVPVHACWLAKTEVR